MLLVEANIDNFNVGLSLLQFSYSKQYYISELYINVKVKVVKYTIHTYVRHPGVKATDTADFTSRPGKACRHFE